MSEAAEVRQVCGGTNRGCCSTVHESRTTAFDQLPFITLPCSIWYVGADPAVKEAFTENRVRSGAQDVLELLLNGLMII